MLLRNSKCKHHKNPVNAGSLFTQITSTKDINGYRTRSAIGMDYYYTACNWGCGTTTDENSFKERKHIAMHGYTKIDNIKIDWKTIQST